MVKDTPKSPLIENDGLLRVESSPDARQRQLANVVTDLEAEEASFAQARPDPDGAPPQRGGSSLASAVFNLSNTILGSGIIAMPYAAKKDGLLPFVLLLMASGVASDFAVGLIFESVQRMPLSRRELSVELSYTLMARRLYGPVLARVASWSVTLQQLGACTAYVVIIGDILGPMCTSIGLDRWVVQLLVLSIIVFPLCLLRKMDSLKYTSLVALLCLGSFVAVVTGWGIYLLTNKAEHMAALQHVILDAQLTLTCASPAECDTIRMVPEDGSFLSTVPLFCFAFLCHQNTFPIFRELREPTANAMSNVAHYSMSICFVVYVCCGIFGYLIFGEATQSDLLKNFPPAGATIDIVMDVLRIGFALALVFSYPIVVWEARHNLQALIFTPRAKPANSSLLQRAEERDMAGGGGGGGGGGGEEHHEDDDLSWRRHLALNAGIVSLTTLVGIVAPDIEVVLGLVGSTCSPTMVFVLPPLFFLRACPPGTAGVTDQHRLFAKALLGFGCLMIPVGVLLWVLKVAEIYPPK